MSDRQIEEALNQSEGRLRAIFESTPIGVSITDREGRIVQSNPALGEILGYDADELAQMTFAEITHPDDVEADTALFAELLAGKRDSYRLEKRYIRKGGDVLWGRLTVSMIDATPDERELVVALMEDITERVRANEQLRQAERFQVALARLIALANSRLEVTETLPAICQAATDAFAMSAACVFLLDGGDELELVASSYPNASPGIRLSLSGDALATVRAVVQHRPVYNNDIPVDISEEMRLVLEKVGARSVLAAPIVVGDELRGALTLLSELPNQFSEADLSRVLRLAQAIGGALRNAQLYQQEQEVAERLRQIERQRSAFLRVMAHEMRTPLGQIIGFMDLLRTHAEQLGDRSTRYLDNAQSAAATLQALMQRSFDLVGLYSAEGLPQREPVLVQQLMESALESCRGEAEGKQLELHYDAPSKPVVTSGQPQLLRQVFEMLLDNAVKFTPRGGMVKVEIGQIDGRVNVTIWDNGPAVPPDMVEHIFAGQAEDALTRHHGGSGLSLLMARKIAELHGGGLAVEPVEQGASFALTLPGQTRV